MEIITNEALFRFKVISLVRHYVDLGYGRTQAVKKVAAMDHCMPGKRSRKIAMRTIYRWINGWESYESKGLEPLKPKQKALTGAFSQEFADFIRTTKALDPDASIPEVIKQARIKGIVSGNVDRSTVYRHCVRNGISVKRCKRPITQQMLRFSMRHRMQMVLTDGKHFRAGSTRVKRVLISFIDDATRKVLYCIVGPAESKDLFLHGLYAMIEHYGLMDKLFLDNGGAFSSGDVMQVLAKLGKALIYGTPSYPEGHGKVERYHRTIIKDVLRSLDKRPDVDTDCTALTLRLQHHIFNTYNNEIHESLNKKTPNQCFSADISPLEFPKSRQKLRDAFTIYESRRVSKDNVIKYGGRHYEIPFGHAGEKIIVHRRILENDLAIIHGDRLVVLSEVDVFKNETMTRAKIKKTPTEGPIYRSADLLFNQQHSTLVDNDGNYRGEQDGL